MIAIVYRRLKYFTNVKKIKDLMVEKMVLFYKKLVKKKPRIIGV
jgi:hypothetical protein